MTTLKLHSFCDSIKNCSHSDSPEMNAQQKPTRIQSTNGHKNIIYVPTGHNSKLIRDIDLKCKLNNNLDR